MSYKIYESAIEKVQECDDYDCGSEYSVDVIEKAEKLLDINFSAQLKDYLMNFGYIEFSGVEIYGIVDESFSLNKNTFEGCMIEWTLNARESNNLNSKWVALRSEDDGGTAFLDFENLNSDGEPCVILAVDTENGYEFECELAEDFGEYLLNLAEEAE